MDEIMGSWFKYLVRLIGLAAIVIILVMVLHKNRAEQEVANVTQLATSIANTYSGQTNFTGITEAMAADIAPSGMVSGAALINQWGGTVTVQVDTNTSQFDIIEDQVPSDGCVDLVNKATNYVSLTLDGTTYNQSNPLNAGTAITACNSAAAQNITFVYGH
jgi:hypothetical protein